MGRAPLCGKKILVTAGPTWVALDQVRVISNVSTGAMGLLLAQKAAAMGADVDLLLGPVERNPGLSKIKVFRFKYFDELKNLIMSRLRAKSYDVILHAAAVSDYVTRTKQGKISSNKKNLVIHLSRAPKLIQIMRDMNPRSFLVLFKLETGVSDSMLIKRCRAAMSKVNADMAVANRFHHGSYRGFVLDADNSSKCFKNRKSAANGLLSAVQRKISI